MRANFILPVAQNVHVSGQPDCEETQIERRPSRYRISTASIGRPSAVWNSALTVPSLAWASSVRARLENGSSRASVSRSACGRFVICS